MSLNMDIDVMMSRLRALGFNMDGSGASASRSVASALTMLRNRTEVEEVGRDLRTDDVSLISHTHGRERRAERGILRAELQAAIKYGRRERANPGRDGSPRWRYTYDGVVYITDETSRHEITSWRIDGKDGDAAVAPAEVLLAGKGSHAVLIVDSSGSMNKSDVPPYKSRAAAVYDCLVRDFVKEQVKGGAGDDVVVTLIKMGNEATVEIHAQPLNESLIPQLERVGRRRPGSHGNCPAGESNPRHPLCCVEAYRVQPRRHPGAGQGS